ncbi:MAG TPA: hypothetical protein VM118_15370, partial [Acidobacteriota bacterium]|nr:hypothetical protein [Acidobacteriota bacterium]
MTLPIRAIVLIDAANYHYALTNRGWRIDWQRFVEFCSRRFGECLFFYYEGTPSKTHYFDRNPGRS